MCKGAVCDGSCRACFTGDFFNSVDSIVAIKNKVTAPVVSKHQNSAAEKHLKSVLDFTQINGGVEEVKQTASTSRGFALTETPRTNGQTSVPVGKIPFAAKYSLIGNRYKCERTIGRGSYGKVKRAHDNVTGEKVAIKFCTGSERGKLLLEREIECMKRLKHPNVVGYLNDFYDEASDSRCLVMEYYSRDLYSVVSTANDGRLPEKHTLRIVDQLLSALHYLHSAGLAHRDLKPENMLLDSDDLSVAQIKICDFGLARPMSADDGLMKTKCGSEVFTAPEVFYQERYNGQKSDIWSLGVVVFSLVTGFNAWARPHLEDPLFHTFLTNQPRFWQWAHSHLPQDSTALSDQLVEFLSRCMDVDANRRWSASDAWQFLNDGDDWELDDEYDDDDMACSDEDSSASASESEINVKRKAS